MARSDDVGNRVLRPPEEGDTGYYERQCDSYRHCDCGQFELRTAEQRGAETVDGGHHRVERIDDPPLLRDDARRISDGRAEEPQLDEQRNVHLHVTETDVERR